jgi:ABC-type Zn uptake system ZnuABC Zn-binding protein ZnuA
LAWNNLQQPSPTELDDLKKAVSNQTNAVFLLSTPPSQALQQVLDDASIEYAVFDIAATTGEKSYLERMSENVRRLEQSLNHKR